MDEEQLFGSGDSSSDEGSDNVVHEEESSEEEDPVEDSPNEVEAENSSDNAAGGDTPNNAEVNQVWESESEDDEYAVDEKNEEIKSESDNDDKASDHEVDDSDDEVEGSDHEADSTAQGDVTPTPGDSDLELDSTAQGDVTPIQDDSDEDDHASAEEDESKFKEADPEESDQDETLAISYAESDKSDEHKNEEGHSASEGTNSDEDEEKEIAKSKNVLNTSSSEEDQGGEKVDNLFGDADDISSSDDNADDDDEEKQIRHVVTDDDDEEEEKEGSEGHVEEPEKEIVETRIEVEIPKIKTDLGSAIHFVRFPNFISAEPRPFDPAVYEDEIEEDDLLDEEGRTRLKLKVENTIRWRKFTDENGIDLTESNARIVRWSDGSMSLHLGSEIFDVHQMSLQGDHNHLFIRQGTGLQGQAVFSTKLAFRPHSTKSATHKKMTNRLAMRHNQNQQKVRVLPIAGQDPESRKAALMKEEEEQLKAHVRREAQKRRMRERSHARGLTANYLEHRYDDGTTNDDDDEGISVAAIKNRFKSGPPGLGAPRKERIYSSDSDSEGEKRLMNAKRLSSDDDDIGAKRRREEDGESRRKTYIVSDDEEEDAAMLST